jgi:dynein heavy chain
MYVLYVEQQSKSRIVGGRSREELLLDIVVDMNNRLPPPFNLELARYKYLVQYEESMNSVLVQELVRFNHLTDVCVTCSLDFSGIRACQFYKFLSHIS